MGKIRVKTIEVEEEIKEVAPKNEPDSHEIKQAQENSEENPNKTPQNKKNARTTRNGHSNSYLSVSSLVNDKQTYTIEEALELLPKLKRAKFDETVELHINTTESGISGSLTLPHGTGKQTRVAIADDKILADVEKGIIEFDILLAEPQMMPKLAKVARILGPRGLMPNPKNGTVTQKPEEVAKKYEGGQVNFKTESKLPLLHLVIGKASFEQKQLLENFKTVIDTIGAKKIKSISLKSTMSPAIKVQI